MDSFDEQLTVDDILSVRQDAPEDQPYNALLKVWREVLRPAEKEQHTKVTPQWANRITSSYRELNFKDMPAFREHYFQKVLRLGQILNDEIEADEECLNVTSTEEDVEHNAFHYLNVLINWQLEFLSWEMAWDCTEVHAGVELASISEVHRMFFAETGLITLLDQINFVLSEADQELLATALQELREQGD